MPCAECDGFGGAHEAWCPTLGCTSSRVVDTNAARPIIRRLGRELALLSAAPDRTRLEHFKVDLARLTAGLDPNVEGSTFCFGAAEVLGTMLNAFYEQDTFKGTGNSHEFSV